MLNCLFFYSPYNLIIIYQTSNKLQNSIFLYLLTDFQQNTPILLTFFLISSISLHKNTLIRIWNLLGRKSRECMIFLYFHINISEFPKTFHLEQQSQTYMKRTAGNKLQSHRDNSLCYPRQLSLKVFFLISRQRHTSCI